MPHVSRSHTQLPLGARKYSHLTKEDKIVEAIVLSFLNRYFIKTLHFFSSNEISKNASVLLFTLCQTAWKHFENHDIEAV